MHDVAIVGAGPVGATLALAIADSDLDIIALDARPEGGTLRGDRSLAISHGARLIFERLGVWTRLAGAHAAVTPITAIDVSQAGGFGVATLTAAEQGLPALGYVVSYVALQAALDAALARTRTTLRHGAAVASVAGSPGAAILRMDDADRSEVRARMAVVADGTGAAVAGVRRERREYGQVALVAKLELAEAHEGRAYERFTAQGPVALLPEGQCYGLVWTMTPAAATRVLALPDADFLAELSSHFGTRRAGFVAVGERKTFPLALEFARPIVAQRSVLIGNAAQSLHPIAGQGFNLGLRDAYELALAINACPREALGEHDMLAHYAARRRADRYGGIAFTHGLTQLFAADSAMMRWPRGIALALLDALPPAKRALTRAMLFGLS